MATFADIYARGGGSLEYRMVIEGAPYEWCNDALVTGSCTESGHVGKRRVHGLARESVGFTESIVMAEARHKVQLSQVRIADGRLDGSATSSGAASDAFSRLESGSLLTWLTADLSSIATSMTVASAAAISNGDYLHLGTEVVLCGTPSGNTVPITRAQWGTTAQALSVATTAGIVQMQPVYSHVPTWVGRRVWVYAHAASELALSDTGTIVYRGIVASQPSEDGGQWMFNANARTHALASDIGPGDSDDYRVRGIYYPGINPLALQIGRHATSSKGAGPSSTEFFALAGFWETQGEFCAALAAGLNAHTTIGTWATWDCVEREDGAWELLYTTPSSGERYLDVVGNGHVDGRFRAAIYVGGGYLHGDAPGVEQTSVSTSTTYLCAWSRDGLVAPDQMRMVPRRNGAVNNEGGFFADLVPSADVASYPAGRIYLTTTRGLAVGSALVLEERAGVLVGGALSGEDSPPQTLAVNAVNTSAGHVDAFEGGSVDGPPRLWVAGSDEQAMTFAVRFGSSAGTNVAGFIAALIAAAPDLANQGACPWLLADDFASDLSDTVEAVTHGAAWANARDYVFTESVRLEDVIREELKLIGCYMALDADFRITFRPLTWGTREVPSTHAILGGSGSHIITGDGPMLDFDGEGTINAVVIKTGWDPTEKKHLGRSIEIIGNGQLAREKRRLELPIEPKSVALAGDITPGDGLAVGRQIVATFGSRAPLAVVDTPLTFWPVLCGDTILLTLPELPFAGVRGLYSPGAGLVNVRARVVERKWSLGTRPTGRFKAMLTNLDVAGYSPAGRVASVSGSGTAWTLTLTATYYCPAGTTDASFFLVGDVIELRQRDSNSPTTVGGTVTAVSGNDVSVSLPASWAGLGGAVYDLHYGATDNTWQESQRKYAAIASNDLTISYDSETETARVFA